MALPVPCTRTTPASEPGVTTVSAITMWSYCDQTQARPQRLGLPISRSSAVGGIDRGHRPERRRAAGSRTQGRSYSGRGAGERLERQVGLHLAAVADDEAVLGDGLADDGEVEVPLVEDRARLGLLLGAEHHQHPLLALGEHHLVGGHPRLAHRHPVEVEPDAEIALVAHLDGRAGEAGGAHVLDRDHRAGRHQLEAGLHQPLLGEGVADLHGRALLLDRGVELGGGHGRAADAVAAGLGAEVDHRHADAARPRSRRWRRRRRGRRRRR